MCTYLNLLFQIMKSENILIIEHIFKKKYLINFKCIFIMIMLIYIFMVISDGDDQL